MLSSCFSLEIGESRNRISAMADPVPVEDPLILLNPEDNIASLARPIGLGDSLRIGDRDYPAEKSLGLGHKIAIRSIPIGGKIIKWGAPIGSATKPIEPGEHVHLHNMKSDYLPTYTLEEGEKYGA